jgi:acetyl esterase/lipase
LYYANFKPKAAKNASSLGADPSKGFIILGTSAGANLAIVTSHMARDKKLSPALTGIALLVPAAIDHANPPAKYKQYSTAYTQNANAMILGKDTMDLFLREYKVDYNSHLYNVFAEPSSNFEGLPPTFLQVCGGDPLRDDGLIYDRALKDAGVKTNLKVYPGTPHAFWSVAPQLKISKQLVRDTVEGIEWLLHSA